MKKPIHTKETRYTYAGDQMDGWFAHVPLNYPGRDAIWAMATGNDGKIYIGLAGEHNRGTAGLAAYDPKTGKDKLVVDLGGLLGDPRTIGRMPHSKIHFALCPHGKYMYFATHVSGASGPEDIHGPVGRGPTTDTMKGFEGGRIFRYDTRTGGVEQFGIPVANEGIRCMHLSRDAKSAYGISYPKHRFFWRDLVNGETYISGRCGKYGGIDLFVDGTGVVWGVHDGHEGTEAGQFYYFDEKARRLVQVNAYLPRSSRRRMCFPRYGNHVLHMTANPDGLAMISQYGESRIALFDPAKRKVYDWNSVWNKPELQNIKKEGLQPKNPSNKPDFAWSPVFEKKSRTVDGKKYDRIVWYGEERWEYQEDVRLSAILYNRERPSQIVKIRFGTPVVGGFPGGHWAASTMGPDGKIYFADRVRDPSTPDLRKYVGLRMAVFTPPKEFGPLEKVPAAETARRARA